MNRKIMLSMLSTVIAVSAVLSGCGGSSFATKSSATAPDFYAAEAVDSEYEEAAYEEDLYDYGNGAAESGEVASIDDSTVENTNRKLIRTININAETREFDQLIFNLENKITQLGGYAETSNISGNSYKSTVGRTAYIVARIPAQNLDSFVSSVETQSNITSKNESATDVTLEYADVQAHKKSLEIEKERLDDLLAQADSLETIIALESRITEVRYELESYETRLRTMDNKVDYSTVNLDITEVKEYKPEPVEELSFGQRLGREFAESCLTAWETIQEFIIGFVAFLPILFVIILILALIGGVIYLIVRLFMTIFKSGLKKRKEGKSKKEKKTAVALDTKPELGEGKEE